MALRANTTANTAASVVRTELGDENHPSPVRNDDGNNNNNNNNNNRKRWRSCAPGRTWAGAWAEGRAGQQRRQRRKNEKKKTPEIPAEPDTNIAGCQYIVDLGGAGRCAVFYFCQARTRDHDSPRRYTRMAPSNTPPAVSA